MTSPLKDSRNFIANSQLNAIFTIREPGGADSIPQGKEKIMFKTFAAVTVCATLFASSSLAALINPGFETGNFSGWTLLGQGHVYDSSFGISPTHGSYMAFIDTTGNFTQLATTIVPTLGVPPSQIAAFGTGAPTNGTA